jgi:hypothetical protein
MKRVMTLACMLGLALVGSLAAQAPRGAMAGMAKKVMTDAEYDTAMKEVGTVSGGLRGAAAAPTDDTVKGAQRLLAIFTDVQAYWTDKKVDDAMGFAKTAASSADALAKALAAKDAAAAGDAQKAMTAQCASCHMAHRTRNPDGSFSIK